MRKTTLLLAVCLGGLLAGCGGGGGGGGGGSLQATPLPSRMLAVTGVGASTNFNFDISTMVGSRYFFTDRTNAAVDVFDAASGTQLAQIKGTGANAFAGQGKDNSTSGPDGLNAVGNLLYVGDVNSVKIVDPSAYTVLKTITVGTQGVRADEACVDTAHGLYFIASPEASPPFLSVINTQTQSLVGTVTFNDLAASASAGLEACEYDVAADTLYINNDGTTANPHGELDVIPGASLRGIAAGATVNYTTLAGVKMYAEGNCDPTGLALGPGSDIAVNCREGTAGSPLLLEILNRNTGVLLAALNAGGGDQLAYVPDQNRYYSAASRWTANGLSSGSSCEPGTVPLCTPRLITVDAASRSILAMVPTGNNAHSVAVDPETGFAFLPVSSDKAPAGCVDCNVGTAGVRTFATKY